MILYSCAVANLLLSIMSKSPSHTQPVQDFELPEQPEKFPIALQLLQVTLLESNNLASTEPHEPPIHVGSLTGWNKLPT